MNKNIFIVTINLLPMIAPGKNRKFVYFFPSFLETYARIKHVE